MREFSVNKMGASIALAMSTCFMFFLYAPLELLFTNQEEFFFDMYILLPLIFGMFLFFFLGSMVLFLLVRRAKWYYMVLNVYFIVFICSYIQGNFFISWLPQIKGNFIDWNAYPVERLKSILLWVIVTILVYSIYKKKGKEFIEKFIRITSICMGLMLLMTLTVLCIATGGYEKKQMLSTATAENILTMSEDKNFVILLLDAVEAPALNEIINEDSKYKELFEDFTYYTNAMGGYPYTHHSIPLILTGEWYEKQCDFEEFSREAYANSVLFERLENEGYRMGIYETDFVIDEGNQERFDNVLSYERRIKSYFEFCKWQIQMVGYRYAPYDLKRFCYAYTNEVNNLKVLPDEAELFQYENYFFWEKLCNNDIKITDENCFRFIHVEGAHDPCLYDEEMNLTETSDYKRSVKASMTITEKYLEKLKEAGIYDSTCIIVMADHGHGTGFNDNPILLIKGFDEHHEMKANDAPISYGDLQEAYAKLLNGIYSYELFEWNEGDYRERRFLFQDDDNNPEQIMEEYVQKGHAGDWDTLIKIKEF